MGKYERWNDLLELLADKERLSVEEAAEKLGVSAATIRRDFDELAQQQMLSRTHGGAVGHTVYDLPLRYKSARHTQEKQRIATRAAQLVGLGGIVGLNGGATTTEVARALATRADVNSDTGSSVVALTIVTNALNIASELAVRPHIKLVVTGGAVQPQSYELIGPLATGLFDQVTLDVAILGINGLDRDAGATCHNEGEASINRLMANRAQQVIVVADGTKVGQRAFAKICSLTDIDVFVTDSSADTNELARFTEAGVNVIQV